MYCFNWIPQILIFLLSLKYFLIFLLIFLFWFMGCLESILFNLQILGVSPRLFCYCSFCNYLVVRKHRRDLNPFKFIGPVSWPRICFILVNVPMKRMYVLLLCGVFKSSISFLIFLATLSTNYWERVLKHLTIIAYFSFFLKKTFIEI